MRNVWAVADTIVSPLGLSSAENYTAVLSGLTGVSALPNSQSWAAQLKDLKNTENQTRFDFICKKAVEALPLPIEKERTLFILSTTKGNIDLLQDDKQDYSTLHLHASARQLARHFGFPHYLVVSNACISGLMAIITGKRFIQNGLYDHAVIVGADVLSDFVIKGFESLMALSNEPCRPFDADRKGINLGEGAAAMLLTGNPDAFENAPGIKIIGAGLSNDANHISGPSRTGEELAYAVSQALSEGKVTPADVDFISAHGTATLYNDEMEAKAFTLAGLNEKPLNSLKGNFGHTLGAAGVIETVMSIHGLLKNEILPTKGFEKHGVSMPVNVNRQLQKKTINTCLKTASGFGGCNAALVLQKDNLL
jgi:3-oxoacyl-[acyl-carrier-protein] synthase I